MAIYWCPLASADLQVGAKDQMVSSKEASPPLVAPKLQINCLRAAPFSRWNVSSHRSEKMSSAIQMSSQMGTNDGSVVT